MRKPFLAVLVVAVALLGVAAPAQAIATSVITAVVGVVTIIFLTYFMLLEGPTWVERFYGLLPERSRPGGARSATTSTEPSAAT